MTGSGMKTSDKQICDAVLVLLAMYVSQDKISIFFISEKRYGIIHFLYIFLCF